MIKYFCSSDIHSFYDEWMDALNIAGFDITDLNHHIIVCGDLFDRGDKSIECLDFVKELHSENRLIYVRGNHEDLLEQCLYELKSNKVCSHHVSNGTLKTISHFMNCTAYDLLSSCYDKTELDTIMQEVVKFIDTASVDYYQLGNTIFVHGWIPISCAEDNTLMIDHNWRQGDWKTARWECGFDNYLCDLVPPDGEAVVCGHWHTSYGRYLFLKEPEWGPKANFTTYINNKLIAIDACTAYTNFVNVVVFDDKGNIL